ncbi:GTP-binding protein Rhes [Condylostylus longicornis]|uniref:GTP-binding protein Rhes n=1 Tax=Condylostylus longicornis TaxID=2530218 RepID=UPI00244E48C9|nr:GTP-binding protein Rhes [Condylostylus longicornis]
MELGDKIGTFSMECSTRINKCGTWFCTRNNYNNSNNNNNNNNNLFNDINGGGSGSNSNSQIDDEEQPITSQYQQQQKQQQLSNNQQQQQINGPTKPSNQITHEIVQGPGPSPGSSGSCDDSEPPPKNCYRLVMLGSARAGKTSLVARFLGGRFEESYTPTIEDFHRKLYRIRGEVHQLDLLDTSGNHPFPAMRRLSFLTGDLFVLVFSMDSRESFEEVIRLREQILETKMSAISGSSRSKKNLPKVPMVIAGNKCDREMKTVQADEAVSYCATQDASCVFVECSAKKNLRVDDLFYELFLAANLPLEMAPNHHKRVSTAFGSPCTLPPHVASNRSKKCTLSIKRRLSDACGVVAPNVRRPSIRTDLMIMRTKTCSLGDGESVNPSNAFGITRINRNNSGCVLQ